MKPPLWIGLLLVLVSSCGDVSPSRVEIPPDSAAGEVAFQWEGPNQAAMVVPVHINGQGPFAFVLDTGATFTCLTETLASELALPEPRGQVGVGAGIGGGGRLRIIHIDSLRVGAARADDLRACAIDLSAVQALGVEADGLLGLNFLREFRVTLDFEREVLGLHQP
jgi:predicted aspartyl protease